MIHTLYIYHQVVFLAVQIPPCRLSVLNPSLQAPNSGFCSFLASHCAAVTFVTLFLLPPSLNPPLLHLSMHREAFILSPILTAPELPGGTDMPSCLPPPFHLKQEENPSGFFSVFSIFPFGPEECWYGWLQAVPPRCVLCLCAFPMHSHWVAACLHLSFHPYVWKPP